MLRGRLLIGIFLVLSPFLFKTTLAANISLGSSSVEFGQGIQVTASCAGSTPLTLTPVAAFVNQSGGGDYKFSAYTLSGIPNDCDGVTFKLSAYTSDSATPLALFNTNSSTSSVGKDGANYTLVNGTGSTITTNSASSYTVEFTNPVSLSALVSRITLQSSASVVPTYDSILFGSTSAHLSFTPGISPGTQPFTIEFWFKTDSSFDGGSILGNSNTTGGLSFILDSDSQAHIDGYGIAAYTYSIPTLQPNTWNHIAIARDGSNRETIWVNGVRSSTGVQNDTINYAGTATFINNAHCTWCVTGSSKFNGERLANLHVVVGSTLYDPTQSSIVVPSMPITSVANTKLLLLFASSGAITSDSSGNQTLTNNGVTFVSGQ